ncbi:cytochrome b [Vibrio sonorensis]|uniref:cytochrome b n=1 Tax=Vibrio sonorensis TaxID=1004316 RepID=UPI0008DA7BCD|nr:cytochrome b/b6 domain-containing protein [Vibrio sonorensis]
MKSYSSTLIVLHWVLALFVFVALFMGNDIASLSNELDLKVDRLVVHMSAGLIMGLAFAARLLLKRRGANRVPKEKQPSMLITLASAYHTLLYVLVFGVVISGVVMALEVDIFTIVEQEATMPNNLSLILSHQVHGALTQALVVASALHILAAFYHQFILKDGLLKRMMISKKSK